MNLCPVDYVAEATVRIAAMSWEQHETEFHGAAFHLCSRYAVTLATICEWLKAGGYKLEEVGAHAFCARVRKVEETHPLWVLRATLSTPVPPGAAVQRHSSHFVTNSADRAVSFTTGPPLPPREVTQSGLIKAIGYLLKGKGSDIMPDVPEPAPTWA